MLRNKTIFSDDFNYMKVSKAIGSRIYDENGTEFIDWTSAWNTTNLGWNNPEIAAAVRAQAEKLPYVHLWNSSEIQDFYAAQLLDALPKGFSYVGRATGGTEANEMALKTARLWTGRKKILGFVGSYHGQTSGLLSFLRSGAFASEDFVPMDFPEKRSDKSDEEILSGFKADLEKRQASKDFAAILCEPGIISGGGATETAPSGFMKIIREATNKYGTLIILDEVGTGFSRTGELFGMDAEGVVPDIATFAKGIANGQGFLGALVTTKEVAEVTHLDSIFVSTFGWTPQSVAAASKNLEIHKRDKVWMAAKQNGEYISSALADMLKDNPYFDAIKGVGMEIGITFSDSGFVAKVIKAARENGLYIVPGTNKNIQIMPQLNIDRGALDEGLDKLAQSFKKAL